MISCLSVAKSQFEPNSCQHNYLQIVTKVDNLAVLTLCTYTNINVYQIKSFPTTLPQLYESKVTNSEIRLCTYCF